MTPIKWILFVGGSVIILAVVGWWYRSREERVRQWVWAASLRALALIILWLLLLNPMVPQRAGASESRDIALLDASLSMSRPARIGAASLWDLSRDSVGNLADVWLFGEGPPRWTTADSTPAQPFSTESQLAPAVRVAASTASGLVVFTDGRLSDAAEARAEAERFGVNLQFRLLTTDYPEIGIARVTATPWVEVGDTADVRVELVARGLDGDSALVEALDDDGRVAAAGWVAAPDAGRYTTLRLRLPVQGRSGFRRYTVTLAERSADPERGDNLRTFFVQAGERPVGPVLLSLTPDWEPMFLLPNLDRLGAAPAAAFLQVSDSWVEIEEYEGVPQTRVQRLAADAPLLVVQGYSDSAPDWIRSLVRRADRLLVFPGGSGPFDLPGWGIRVSSAAAGEWYLSRELPASPLALDLNAESLEQLPPLIAVRRIEAERAWSPINVQRMRRGAEQAAVAAGSMGSRRWAVATGEGYWRWAFRRGPGRQLYRSLWTGLGGWLLEGREQRTSQLDPLERVVERGEPLRWVAPFDVDSIVVSLSSGEQTVMDRVAAAGDTLAARAAPGSYAYNARAYRGGNVVDAAEGPVEVESFSRELLPREVSIPPATQDLQPESRGAEGGSARPLSSMGWPYLLLIALFCGEWAVRRFSGLR